MVRSVIDGNTKDLTPEERGRSEAERPGARGDGQIERGWATEVKRVDKQRTEAI